MPNRLDTTDFVAAMRSLNMAKNLFMILILVALLSQMVLFSLLEFTDVFSQTVPRGTSTAASAPAEDATQPAEDATALAASPPVITYQSALRWTLGAGKFLAFVCACLTLITMIFAASLALVGGGRGIPAMFRSFCWSLVLLAAVTPWQNVLHGSVACGALFSFGELSNWFHLHARDTSQVLAGWIYYARFLGYPLIAIITWVIVMARFGSGYRRLIITKTEVLSQGPAQPSQ